MMKAMLFSGNPAAAAGSPLAARAAPAPIITSRRLRSLMAIGPGSPAPERNAGLVAPALPCPVESLRGFPAALARDDLGDLALRQEGDLAAEAGRIHLQIGVDFEIDRGIDGRAQRRPTDDR